MRILGIDPGLAIVGWGVIDYEASKFKTVAYGALRTPAGICTEERLRLIYSGMQELLREYRPDAMAIEELFFHTNVTTGIRVAEARGVLLLAAHQAGISIQEYTPAQVKQAVVGYGKAEKKQVMTMVTMLLGLREVPKPDDTADALAIAICHAHSGGSRLASYFNKNTI
ncbi:MAG: crossover junction endodeoxyribonuclease RuvC [Ruminococcaceae bacterium]|nr:crossover junction endodeoxyribonuclease RuvC [Oscillospiraceae bacterium]